jgi:hypothetical protein
MASFGNGLCNTVASSTEPVSHVSHSCSAVKSTGMALAWIGRTTLFDSVVRENCYVLNWELSLDEETFQQCDWRIDFW